ncbi:MAG: oxygen-independent coproporphyrinogen III oxidase [Rubricella sp.]
MNRIETFARAGLFDRSVPRYTSYPPANHFTVLQPGTQMRWLEDLPRGPISLYIHIPFCERLCWFCACRTQAVNGPGPVESYLKVLRREIAAVASCLPGGVTVGRMHWGGGTPTILSPDQIRKLAHDLRSAFTFDEDGEFSVEIDPACVDTAKLNALVEAGLNRASVGIQDFAIDVQDTIGRHQSFDQTRGVLDHLRDHGVTSLNADLVYGLPRQTMESLAATIEKIGRLDPDRIALYGYAHVPWMSKRQRVIPEETLPSPHTRFAMAEMTALMLAERGFDAIGIDHFAKPADGLAIAKRTGHLRRNFQGYTDDTMTALVGLGASSISRLPQGYVQNAPATPAWSERVENGHLPGMRGHAFTAEDTLRARAIERLMCGFEIDMPALAVETGQDIAALSRIAAALPGAFPGCVTWENGVLAIPPAGRPLTRLVAERFDAYADPDAMGRHSQAI